MAVAVDVETILSVGPALVDCHTQRIWIFICSMTKLKEQSREIELHTIIAIMKIIIITIIMGQNFCPNQAGPAPAQLQLHQNNPTNQLSA